MVKIYQDNIKKNNLFIYINIIIVRDNKKKKISYNYQLSNDKERPMALDVLLQAQKKEVTDLAFRYGCRARNCGICTIDINDKPRLACRARVRKGDTLSAIATLPVLADLVVKRDGIARQLRGIGNIQKGNELNKNAPDRYHTLTACIECYACLDKCPMHEKNFAKNSSDNNKNLGYKYGNPFSLLKLERLRQDPITADRGKEVILEKAIDLGLSSCIDCPGCKCGVGINLKENVIKPLLSDAAPIMKFKKA